MMIGVAFSRGEVSIRTTSPKGSSVPRWAGMSSSAGNDIAAVLLRDVQLIGGSRGGAVGKRCKRRDFVGRAFDADDRRTIGVQRTAQRVGQLTDVLDVDRRQAGEHCGQPGAEPARPEPAVA